MLNPVHPVHSFECPNVSALIQADAGANGKTERTEPPPALRRFRFFFFGRWRRYCCAE